jgi:hypothetical protein
VVTRGNRVNKDSKELRARRDHRAKLVTVGRLAQSVQLVIPATVARTVLLAPRVQSGLRDSQAHRANRVNRGPLDSRVLPAGPGSREMLAVLASLEQLVSLVSPEVLVSRDRWEPVEPRARLDLKDQLGNKDHKERPVMLGRSGPRETPDPLGLRESRVQLGQLEVLDSLD